MDRYRAHFILGICIAAFASAFFWGIPTHCVQLPNGMNIGKQAIIDFAKPYFLPEVVPKFPNGKSLLPGDAWPFFTTETTVYGIAETNDADDDFRFAWRMDTGLIRRNEDPIRYQRLIDEAGPLLDGTRHGGFGSIIIMWQLQKQPAYADQTCRTRWIAIGNPGI